MIQAKPLVELGFGDRAYVPFFGREQFVELIAPNELPQAPEELATAAMVLCSLGMPPVHQSNHAEYATAARKNKPKKTIRPAVVAGTLDFDVLTQATRITPSREVVRRNRSPLVGLEISLLERNLRVQRISATPLGASALSRLGEFGNFSQEARQPVFNDLQRTTTRSGQTTTELLPGLGTRSAAVLEIDGGLPDLGLQTPGRLAFVIIGANPEKVKVHSAGNADILGIDGENFQPSDLFNEVPATLTLIDWPEGGSFGTPTQG